LFSTALARGPRVDQGEATRVDFQPWSALDPSKTRDRENANREQKMSIRGTVAAAFVLAIATALPAVAQEPFQWTGTLSGDQRLDVRAISGDVRAVLASGTIARVVAHKRGDAGDFDEVEVRAFEEGDRVIICVIYGSRNFDREGCDGEGRHRGDDIRVSVHFEVEVPAGVEFGAGSVSGDVDIEGLRSDVHARSVSGDVRVTSTGVVRASSVSGELDIDMGSLDWADLRLNTVSGDITLRMPADLGARVEFRSVSGDMHSEFPVRLEGIGRGQRRGNVTGVIGDGSRSLELRTVSGNVDLLMRR
jgi:hypothetical protein